MRRVFRPAIPMLCSGDKTLLYNTMFLRCLTVPTSILAGSCDRPSTISFSSVVSQHIIVRNLQVVEEIQDVKTEMYDGKMKREIEQHIIYYTRERKNIVLIN